MDGATLIYLQKIVATIWDPFSGVSGAAVSLPLILSGLVIAGNLGLVLLLLWQGQRPPGNPQPSNVVAGAVLLSTYTLSQIFQVFEGEPASLWHLGVNGLGLGVAIAFFKSSQLPSGTGAETQQLEQRNRELELAVSQQTEELGVQNERLNEILSELQRMQVNFIQLDKMSTLGQMVAGISHELHNPINFISGNLPHVEEYVQDLVKVLQTYQTTISEQTAQVQAVLEDGELDFILQDLPRVIDSIKSGTDRIQHLVQNLQTFYQPDATGMKPINLQEHLESILILLQNRYKKRIEVVRQFEAIPAVECYPNQLNQVFMNLISNAIEVLLEHPIAEPKQIVIATRRMGTDRVAIMVADNGMGMPLEVQAHLFEPFYTTKPSGIGTGLGLSISHQIVTEVHHGRIYCCSALGEGTTFIVELPISQGRSPFLPETNVPTLPTQTTVLNSDE